MLPHRIHQNTTRDMRDTPARLSPRLVRIWPACLTGRCVPVAHDVSSLQLVIRCQSDARDLLAPLAASCSAMPSHAQPCAATLSQDQPSVSPVQVSFPTLQQSVPHRTAPCAPFSADSPPFLISPTSQMATQDTCPLSQPSRRCGQEHPQPPLTQTLHRLVAHFASVPGSFLPGAVTLKPVSNAGVNNRHGHAMLTLISRCLRVVATRCFQNNHDRDYLLINRLQSAS